MKCSALCHQALPRLQGAAELSYLKGPWSSVCNQGSATVPLRQSQDLSKQCCCTSENEQLCAAAERQPTQIHTRWGCSRDCSLVHQVMAHEAGLLHPQWALAASWELLLGLLLTARCEVPCGTVTSLSWRNYQNALVNQVPWEDLCLLCRYFSLKLSGKTIGEYT